MIIVKLNGGLGNQMFQYATARRLAEKHSTILKLDISGFEYYKLHRYSLHCFNIWEHLAIPIEIRQNIGRYPNKVETIRKKILTKLGIKRDQYPNWVIEKEFQFDINILQLEDNTLLEGYWQSEKYFAEIKNILYREFSIKYPQDQRSKEINHLISNTNSVSLHIRRGDYISNSTTNTIHGVCSLSYYKDCIKEIIKQIKSPVFFVFSDDPIWAKNNLNITNFQTVFVDHNDASKNYEDLRLMSQCKHNIIANSSFSWWGAWLNQNPQKIVYSPKKWFNDPSLKTQDLIPNTWIQI